MDTSGENTTGGSAGAPVYHQRKVLQPPLVVTNAIAGHFIDHDSQSLLLNKGTRIELWKISAEDPDVLVLVQSVTCHVRVQFVLKASLSTRSSQATLDRIFLFKKPDVFSLLKWDTTSNSLVEEVSGSLVDLAVDLRGETLQYPVIPPARSYCLQVWDRDDGQDGVEIHVVVHCGAKSLHRVVLMSDSSFKFTVKKDARSCYLIDDQPSFMKTDVDSRSLCFLPDTRDSPWYRPDGSREGVTLSHDGYPILLGLFESLSGEVVLQSWYNDDQVATVQIGPWQVSNCDITAEEVLPVPTSLGGGVVVVCAKTFVRFSANGAGAVVRSPSTAPISIHTRIGPAKWLFVTTQNDILELTVESLESMSLTQLAWGDRMDAHHYVPHYMCSLGDENLVIGSFQDETPALYKYSSLSASITLADGSDSEALGGNHLPFNIATYSSASLGDTFLMSVGGRNESAFLDIMTRGYRIPSIIENGLEVQGVPNLFVCRERLADGTDSYLIFSYAMSHRTQVLSIRGEEFAPAEIPGLVEDESTLAMCCVRGDILVQVTPTSVNCIHNGKVQSWQSEKSGGLEVAAVDEMRGVVYVGCGSVVQSLIVSPNGDIQVGSQATLPHQVSCLTFIRNEDAVDYLLLGEWLSNGVVALDRETLEERARFECGPSRPRSVDIISNPQQPKQSWLVAGLSSGEVRICGIDVTSAPVLTGDWAVYRVGHADISLLRHPAFTSKGEGSDAAFPSLFAFSDRSAMIEFHGGSPVVKRVTNCIDARSLTIANSSALELVAPYVNSDGLLTFGSLVNLKEGLTTRSCDIEDVPVEVAYHQQSDCAIVVARHIMEEQGHVPEITDTIRVYHPVSRHGTQCVFRTTPSSVGRVIHSLESSRLAIATKETPDVLDDTVKFDEFVIMSIQSAVGPVLQVMSVVKTSTESEQSITLRPDCVCPLDTEEGFTFGVHSSGVILVNTNSGVLRLLLERDPSSSTFSLRQTELKQESVPMSLSNFLSVYHDTVALAGPYTSMSYLGRYDPKALSFSISYETGFPGWTSDSFYWDPDICCFASAESLFTANPDGVVHQFAIRPQPASEGEAETVAIQHCARLQLNQVPYRMVRGIVGLHPTCEHLDTFTGITYVTTDGEIGILEPVTDTEDVKAKLGRRGELAGQSSWAGKPVAGEHLEFAGAIFDDL